MEFRVALILFLASVPAAHADIVKWQASGHVTSQLAYEPGNGGVVGPGLFQVTLTLDTATVDSDPSATRGSYGSLIAVDIWLDGQPFSEFYGLYNGSFIPDAESALIVENDEFADGMFTDSFSIVASDSATWGDFPPWGDVPFNQLFLRLAHQSDTPGSLLTSDAVPGAFPDLQRFEIREFLLGGLYNTSQAYSFEVSVDSLAPVPVPAAVWMLLSGLSLLGAARRARRDDLAQPGVTGAMAAQRLTG